MTVTTSVLVGAKYIETTDTVQFSAATATVSTIIDAVFVTNTTASAVKLSVSVVADGVAVSNENRAIYERIIRPNETYLCPELLGQSLNPDGFVSAKASVANALNFRATGRVVIT